MEILEWGIGFIVNGAHERGDLQFCEMLVEFTVIIISWSIVWDIACLMGAVYSLQ